MDSGWKPGCIVVRTKPSRRCWHAASKRPMDDNAVSRDLASGAPLRCRCEAVATHHVCDGCRVRRAAGGCLDHGGDFAEVVRTKDAGSHNRQHLCLGRVKIVEAMNSSARDTKRLAWSDFGLSPIYRKSQHARESVDGFLVGVMTMR